MPYPLNGFLFVEWSRSFHLTRRRCSTLCEGSSPLQLLWKDAQTATYFIDTDAEGRVREVQEVTVGECGSSQRSCSTRTARCGRWRDSWCWRRRFQRWTTTRSCGVW